MYQDGKIVHKIRGKTQLQKVTANDKCIPHLCEFSTNNESLISVSSVGVFQRVTISKHLLFVSGESYSFGGYNTIITRHAFPSSKDLNSVSRGVIVLNMRVHIRMVDVTINVYGKFARISDITSDNMEHVRDIID